MTNNQKIKAKMLDLSQIIQEDTTHLNWKYTFTKEFHLETKLDNDGNRSIYAYLNSYLIFTKSWIPDYGFFTLFVIRKEIGPKIQQKYLRILGINVIAKNDCLYYEKEELKLENFYKVKKEPISIGPLDVINLWK